MKYREYKQDKYHWRTAVIENEAYTQEAVIKTMKGPWELFGAHRVFHYIPLL